MAFRAYEKTLNEFLDRIYLEADNLSLSWPALAEAAGLSYATIWRIGNRETKLPRFQTALYLAKAVGMDVELHAVRKTRLRVIS